MFGSWTKERIVAYLLSNADRVTEWPDLLQMVVLDLIHKVCRSANRANKGKYITIISSLQSSSSTAVVYECQCSCVALLRTDCCPCC
jgi:coatomer subunit beta